METKPETAHRITLRQLLDRMYAEDFKGTYLGIYPRDAMRALLRPMFKSRSMWRKGQVNKIRWGYFLHLRTMALRKYERGIPLFVKGKEITVYVNEHLLNSILMAFLEAGVLTTDSRAPTIYRVYQRSNGRAYSSLCILPSPSSFETQLYFRDEVAAKSYAEAFRSYPYLNDRKAVFIEKVTTQKVAC